MPIYNKYINQVVSGTQLDSHGEKRDKSFFEDLIQSMPSRIPLGQNHDMKDKSLGYLENFRMVSDKNNSGEWHLIADIYITSNNVDEALNGFSFTATEKIKSNSDAPQYYVFVPYPLYNDDKLIDELANSDENILVGKWIKKSLDPTMIGLVATGLAVFFGPEWDIQYKKNIRPLMEKIIKEYIPKLKDKDISVDLLQQVIGPNDETVQAYFVPDRSNVEASYGTNYMIRALNDIGEFLFEDEKSKSIGVERVKLYFDRKKDKYILFHAQYTDGSDVNII